jgi:DNA-binding transcriptional LysR family regulator
MLSLVDLRFLLRAVETGSLTGAAGQLDVTPAAVSAAIKRLEAHYGARLLERSTRSLRLTPEGAAVRDAAERAFAALAEAEAGLKEDPRALEGTIRLAAPSDLSRSWLFGWLDEFLSQHPRLHLALTPSDTTHDLLRDAVDLSIRYGDLPDSRLVARKLAEFRRVVCAAPSYLATHGTPTTPQDLAGHNCLTLHLSGRAHSTWRFRGSRGELAVRVRGDRSSDDGWIVRQWALRGIGIVQKTALDVISDLAEGRLVQLLPEYASDPVPVHALYLGARYQPLRVRKLIDFLAGKFATLPQDA